MLKLTAVLPVREEGKKANSKNWGGLIRSNLIVHACLFFLIALTHCFHF